MTNNNHIQSFVLAERVFRLFMDGIKRELKMLKIDDINSIQTIVLYNIGKEKMTVGDLISRKFYLGSNVTYNLKKMVESGYVEQEKSKFDKRSSYIKLAKKGLDLYKKFENVFLTQMQVLENEGLDSKNFSKLGSNLKILEKCLVQANQIV